jgi:hypothetical protein
MSRTSARRRARPDETLFGGAGAGAVALGIATHLGWASVVTIAPARGWLRVLRVDRLLTADPDDIEAQAPYHRAAGYEGARRIDVPPDPAAVVERGLLHQRSRTLASLSALAAELREAGQEVRAAAILAGRGRAGASLERVLASHSQIHVAEGNAVRDAFAHALERLEIQCARIEQQTVLGNAAAELRTSAVEIERRLRATRPERAGPWRQEQRLAALAARAAAALVARRPQSREPRAKSS